MLNWGWSGCASGGGLAAGAALRPTLDTVDRPIADTVAGSPLARVEPITLDQTKIALKISDDFEDTVIETWIAAARAIWEQTTERQTITAEREWTIEGTPRNRRIEIPRPPLTHVVSVTYDDAAGVSQTIDPAEYRVTLSATATGGSPPALLPIDPYCRPGAIELLAGSWPTTTALRVRRLCGYGATPADMPPVMQAALYLLVGHFYKYREETTSPAVSVIPLGAQMLMVGFKYPAIARRVEA
jgi:uncharacterized phiE125 gp8 family phage protein